MKWTKSEIFLVVLLALCALFLASCMNQDRNPIPPAGSKARSTTEALVFRQTASDLQQYCQQIGGCTCTIDGIQTTCAVVFACLDAGFCELVAAE